MLSITKEPKHAAKWRSGRFLAVALAVYAVIGLLGLITPIVPALERQVTEQNLADFLLPPFSEGYLFGTDELGRDFMWRLIGGLAVSMSVGLVAAALSIILGLVLGIIGGFYRRTAGASVAVLVDVTWAFPEILLAIMLAGWLGPGLRSVVLALALTGWASFAKIVRGEVLSLRERDFVAASRVLGMSKLRISLRHLVPNLVPVMMVMTVFFMAAGIIAEAGLSFLGLGAQPPTPSLGLILARGRDSLHEAWWLVVFASALLGGLVILLNAASDYLRDRLDPAHIERK